MEAEMQGKAKGTQVIRRATQILSAIARRSPAGVGLSEIAQRTGLAQATARRILRGLLEERLVTQNPTTHAYLLGPLVYEFGVCSTQQSGLIRHARPALERLAMQTGDTVYLIARSGAEAVCLDRVEGNFPVRVVTTGIGNRRPLGVGAVGLAILARLQESEIDAVLRTNAADYSIYGLELSDLRTAIRLSRERSYGFSDGLLTAGVSGIGLPILSPGGSPVAGISIASTSDRMSPARLAELFGLLRSEIAGIHLNAGREHTAGQG
ncbi:IclR family transcriptional regulator [Pseudoroseomonas ludipueritiae]|uniref:IclR family transcriptional regulator n=1 Tax=Pseudoroseomonas ludipueritiae TaxID=198093 RepID=A0ABR7RBV7_9PROT|nr:IclR family transcriptional regulator [Pseudoroseomonas ludipueritiae]MBC9179121.1 IclR family transcriptional regulator [Pseudoroseomonas ludipueritiae]MCG7361424.1 IclR family transcriptional regulator [Roseomonas sp. ACRSG]